MDSGTLVAANNHLDVRRPGLRRASVVAALAMILATFVLLQRPADAAPSVGAAGAGVSAQTNFNAAICAILFDLRDDYDDTPFFSPAVAVIDELLVEYGCIPGPTTTTVAPVTTTTRPPTTTTTVVVPPAIPANTCAVLLATRASFVGTQFAVFIPFIDIALAGANCVPISG